MRRTVKTCASLFRIRLAEGLQYRLSALSGVLTSLVWALIEVAVFRVFFQYADNAAFGGGLTLEQAVSHVWVKEMLLILLPYSIDGEFLEKINSGDLGVELCRPVGLYGQWFSRSAAGKVSVFLLRGLVCFAIALLIPYGFGARPPVSLDAFLLFVPSVLCAFLLCTSYGMLVTAMRVDITWGDGPMHLMLNVAQVLSGQLLPLQLWPDFLQPFLLVQPFAGLCDIPARLYIGSMRPQDAWIGMGVQLLWTGVFVLLGKAVMARRLRNIVAQGG